ncbi:MAG TPA: ATP-binding protein [Novosphingobium sp.]|nr:ATP-binding protein [Novosphingobium sp.]
MKQVFSRWPGERGPGPSDAAPARHWAHEGPVPASRSLSRSEAWLLVVAVGVLAGSIVLLPVALAGWGLVAAALLLIGAAAVVLVGLRRIWRHVGALERENEGLRDWNATLFDRAGVSLWREDWSEARDAVEHLLLSGVTDIQAYYAERPAELRDLRRRVIIKDVNAIALEGMGVDSKADVVGSLDNILPDTDHTFVQWLIAFARGDRLYRSETHLVRPDGSALDTLFTASIPQDREGFRDIVVANFEITAYKAAQARMVELERDLIRASRITTMGALSATIAHEVNSPLAAVLSHAEAGLRWLDRAQPDLSEVRAAIAGIVADASRARDVVVRTRSYLANAPADGQLQDMARLGKEALLLVERELRDGQVSPHFDFEDGLPPVAGDPIQLQQVLVNLMLNGAQAMRAKPSARDLTVTMRREGEFIRVNVRDEGEGIDPADAARIFDPFYSTRPGGMGMGLAICRTVVEAHGGRIWVSTEPGGGSTFHFLVPAATGQQA